MYKSEYFVNLDGSKPVEEFIDKLPAKAQAKFEQIRQDYLHVYGPQNSNKILRKVEEFREIRWLRKYRVMCYLTGNTYILLSGFTKDTQKTPSHYIEQARRYKTIDETKKRQPGNRQ